MKKVASFSIVVDGVPSFSIHMEGTIQNDSLPLADQLLKFDQVCSGTCEFRPIAPIQYTFTLMSTGMLSITDTIDVPTGQSIVRQYTMKPDIVISPIENPLRNTETEGLILIALAHKRDPGYTYINLLAEKTGSTIVERKSDGGIREVGELTSSGFSPWWRVPKGAGELTLDVTSAYFIAPLYTDSTLIVSRDFREEKEVKLQGVIGYVPGREEKFLTQSGVLMSYRGSYGENPRFTDWIDLSSNQRLGYIASDDDTRLTLSNYQKGTSVLILLDRNTGESQVIRRGIDVRFFFFRNGKPVYVDSGGMLYGVSITGK